MRVSLPPDANRLPGVTDHGLRSSDRDNVILAGKPPEPQGSTWTHVVAQGLDRPGMLNRRPSGGAPPWERAA